MGLLRPTAVLMTGLGLLVGCAAPEYTGIVRTPPPEVGVVALPEVSNGGEPSALRPANGDMLAVYFGYTSCPDVCPTTLADFRKAMDELGDDAERVELAMVTVDPEVDTAEVLTAYVRSFSADGRAFRSTDETVMAEAAAPFGAASEIIESGDGGREVVHSAHLYLVDADGQLMVQWPFGHPADAMASDMALALSQ